MKLLCIVTFCVLSINTYCQDLITLKNGDQTRAKILEMSPTEIRFNKQINDSIYESFVRILNKVDVFMINYSNGTKEVFNNKPSEPIVEVPKITVGEGKTDAAKYYSGQGCGAGGVLLTTVLISPLIGLIPAIAISSKPPLQENLNIPKDKVKNSEYLAEYTSEAYKIKKGIVWRCWGAGAVISVVATILILSL